MKISKAALGSTLIALGIATITSVSVAQSKGSPIERGDTDNDGRLNFEEAAASVPGMTQDRFNEHDTNGDGFLDEQEMRTRSGRTATASHHRGEEHFNRIDANNDGEASLEEIQAHHARMNEEMFSRLDQDGSGGLDKEELKRGREHARRAGGGDRKARFDAADSDGDGELSQDELSTVAPHMDAERFAMIDTDGSGAASPEELKSARERFGRDHSGEHKERHGDRRAKMREADTNGDGKFSQSELTTVLPDMNDRRFKYIDADDDGFVTPEELREARERHGGKRDRDR